MKRHEGTLENTFSLQPIINSLSKMTVIIAVILYYKNLAMLELPVWPEVREICKICKMEVKQ